jgi:glycosyltransferase involved in cell wall biosynthesis
MLNQVKVAIITNSRTGGGAERAMNTLARELSKNPRLELVMIPINAGPDDLINPECHIFDINRTWRGTLVDSFKAYLRFQLLIHRLRPDVVILNCDLPEFLFTFTFSRAKVIVVDHSTKSWENRPFIGKLIWLRLRGRTSTVVRVSNRIATRNPVPKSDLVIPNPLPAEVIRPKSIQLNSTMARLVFIGRLSQEKDPKLFCEIASKCDLHSMIIGDGPMRQSLKEQYPRFNWVGRVPNPWELISSGDLLLLSSRYEGDGLVLLEALANGISVLVRDTPDFRAFNLPEMSYFNNSEDAALKISLFTSGAEDFKISQDSIKSLVYERNAEKIANDWSTLILNGN